MSPAVADQVLRIRGHTPDGLEDRPALLAGSPVQERRDPRKPLLLVASATRAEAVAADRTVAQAVNFYNDNDPRVCAWLRELIADGRIPPGIVDGRSITEIEPHELTNYCQCHFFNGISGWSLALELAGWPAERPVWTASLPCPSFSCAGKGKGFDDPRGQLWHPFFRLVRECRPVAILGEQVEAAISHGWLDRVFSDLEAEGFACGACVLGAHSAGAPHIRQRLYWVAHAASDGYIASDGLRATPESSVTSGANSKWEPSGSSDACGVADAASIRLDRCDTIPGGISASTGGAGDSRTERRSAEKPERNCATGGLGDTDSSAGSRFGQHCGGVVSQDEEPERSGAATAWSEYDLIRCAGGRTRRTQPGIFPLVARLPRGVVPSGDPSVAEANASAEARVMRLRGYGNSIVPQVAAEFVRAYMEIIGL